jgi:hypothetical protein
MLRSGSHQPWIASVRNLGQNSERWTVARQRNKYSRVCWPQHLHEPALRRVRHPDRVIAQVMELGDFDSVQQRAPKVICLAIGNAGSAATAAFVVA